jgi:phospholipase C
MHTWAFGKHKRNGAVVTATVLALVGAQPGLAQSAPDTASYGANGRDGTTSTPIKHVIIIIGENRTFDNVFATYVPQPGNTVWNLLSEGIVNADGTPGPNYSKALQSSAKDYQTFQLAPPKTPYVTLPPFQVGGPYTPYGCQLIGYANGSVTDCNSPANVAKVMPYENGLAPDYYKFLLTGGTGQKSSGDTDQHF